MEQIAERLANLKEKEKGEERKKAGATVETDIERDPHDLT